MLFKVFELQQKAELHREIAEVAILNKVTKADYEVYKDSILSWLPALMQHQKSMEKDFKQKVSAKDSGVEIGDDDDDFDADDDMKVPKESGDTQVNTQVQTQVPTAEIKASKNKVNQLKEKLNGDLQSRDGVLQVNAEMLTEEDADMGLVSHKQDQITTVMIGEKQESHTIAEDDAEIQFATASRAHAAQQGAHGPVEAISDMQFLELTETYDEEHVETTYEAEFGVDEQQEKVSSEKPFQEEVAKSEAVMQSAADSCQDDKLVAEGTNKTKDETVTASDEAAIYRNVETQDGSQATGEDVIVENSAKEQDTREGPVEKMTEHRAEVIDDHNFILQEQDNLISDLKDENVHLQDINGATSALAEDPRASTERDSIDA